MIERGAALVGMTGRLALAVLVFATMLAAVSTASLVQEDARRSSLGPDRNHGGAPASAIRFQGTVHAPQSAGGPDGREPRIAGRQRGRGGTGGVFLKDGALADTTHSELNFVLLEIVRRSGIKLGTGTSS